MSGEPVGRDDTSVDWPLPDINPANRPFWEGASEGTLVIQRCPECETTCYPPRIACPRCFGDLEWFESEGRGTVFTYGIVHRPSKPQVFDQRTPFVTAGVELAEGGVILTNLLNCAPDDVEIGMEVTALFKDVSDEISIPQFEPADV